jgi:hypothetical protein
VDPVPDPLLLRKSDDAGNRTRASGYVARNSDVSTIEELLERKSSGSGRENREYDLRGSAVLTTRHPSIRKNIDTNFTDKRRSLT